VGGVPPPASGPAAEAGGGRLQEALLAGAARAEGEGISGEDDGDDGLPLRAPSPVLGAPDWYVAQLAAACTVTPPQHASGATAPTPDGGAAADARALPAGARKVGKSGSE
jgi:hypothetical protein